MNSEKKNEEKGKRPSDFPRSSALPKERRSVRWNDGMLRARAKQCNKTFLEQLALSFSLSPAVKIFRLAHTVNIRRIGRPAYPGLWENSLGRLPVPNLNERSLSRARNVALSLVPFSLRISFCTTIYKAPFRSDVYNERGENVKTPSVLMTRARDNEKYTIARGIETLPVLKRPRCL